MATASDALRVQLLSIAQQLLTASTSGPEVAEKVKEEMGKTLQLWKVRVTFRRFVKKTQTADSRCSRRTSFRPSSRRSLSSTLPIHRPSSQLFYSSHKQHKHFPPLPFHLLRRSNPLHTPFAPRPSAPCPLPTELVAQILNQVYTLSDYKERQRSFMSNALVSRAFYRAAKGFLDKELVITDAEQFRGLASRLNKNSMMLAGVTMAGVTSLALDFDFSDLRNSLGSDSRGRNWLSPIAGNILGNMKLLQYLVIGGNIFSSWFATGDSDEFNFFDGLEKEIGVDLAEMAPSLKLLKIEPRLMGTHDFLSLHVCLLLGWKSIERLEFECRASLQALLDRGMDHLGVTRPQCCFK